jgi:hypothetical protein
VVLKLQHSWAPILEVLVKQDGVEPKNLYFSLSLSLSPSFSLSLPLPPSFLCQSDDGDVADAQDHTELT